MRIAPIKNIKGKLFHSIVFSLLSLMTVSCGVNEPLKVAHNPWPGYELIGLYQSLVPESNENFSIVRTQDSGESVALLKSGQVDAAAITMDEALILKESGTKIKVVLIFNISAGADVIVGNNDISEPNKLINKRIAYTPGGLSTLILTKFFENTDSLDWDDVELIPIETSEHQSVLQQGRAEAVVTYPPASRQLLLENKYTLFDSSQMPNLIFDVLVLRESSLNFFNQGRIKNLVSAYFEGRQHLIANPHDASFRLAEKFGLPAEEVLNSYQGLVLPDSIENHRLLGGEPPLIARHAYEIVDILASNGLISKSFRPGEVFTDDYLPVEFSR